MEHVLKYIEDGDLQRWSLEDIKAFNIGIKDWRSRLNCITNQYVFEQVWYSLISTKLPVTTGCSMLEPL